MRSIKSNLILFAICLVASGIYVFVSSLRANKRVTVPAVIRYVSPTTIKRTKTTARGHGRVTTITTPVSATLLQVDFNYKDSLYTKELKREGYKYGTYAKGDTISISIDTRHPGTN